MRPRIAIITWRNQRTARELSGGNTRRIYLSEKIIEFVSSKFGDVDVYYVTIEELDSVYSKILALGGRAISYVSTRIGAALRELRFHYINCGTINKIIEKSDVVVLDHVRSVVMASRCNKAVKNPVIVILHDYHREFPYGVNFFTRIVGRLSDKRIKEYLENAGLLIAASVRDAVLYKEHLTEANILVYPNLYYPRERIKINKDNSKLIINVVLPRVHRDIVINIVKRIRRHVKDVEIRGINVPDLPGVKNLGKIPSREKYLETLAEGHIGINFTTTGFQSGSNVKRYDYAIAGNVPLNYMSNAIGEPLPHEYTFVDEYDLFAKILTLDLERLIKYGMENAEYTYLKSIEYNMALNKALYKLLIGQ